MSLVFFVWIVSAVLFQTVLDTSLWLLLIARPKGDLLIAEVGVHVHVDDLVVFITDCRSQVSNSKFHWKLLQSGQILEGFSISAGLDYPGIGPEHAWLHEIGRAQYVSITDKEALAAFQLCCDKEGIIPALEPSHALAHVMKIAPDLPKDHIIIMNMCGRGDKDIFTVARHLGFDMGTEEGR